MSDLRNKLGLCHEGLYSKAKSGSKHLAENYTSTVQEALLWFYMLLLLPLTQPLIFYVPLTYAAVFRRNAHLDCRGIKVYLRAAAYG